MAVEAHGKMKSDYFTKLKQLINRILTSSLVRSSGIYTVSSFLNASIPLLLLPLLTHKLTPGDYGIIVMFQLVVSGIYPFIGMNLEAAIERKYYDKDGTDFKSYIGTCFLLLICSFLIVSLIFVGFSSYINDITKIPKSWLKYTLVVALCQFITAVILITYQVRVKPIKYGIFQISQSFLNLGLTLILILGLNKSWNGRIEAQIIAGVIFSVVSFILLFHNNHLGFNIKRKYAQHALKFGLPLIPHAIGAMLFTAIDRFFLTNLIGLEQTGNFTVAYQIGSVLSLLTVAFNTAFVPWLFDNLNKDDITIKKKIVKFTYLYFIVLSLIAVFLLLFFPFLVSILVGKSFTTVNTFSTFIVFSFVFQGMYFMVINYIVYSNKTYIQAIITFTVALIKIPVTYYLIIQFGASGAAISTFFTFLLFFCSTWLLSAYIYPMPWNIFKSTTH